jgi:osmotically-inducible protein OsmY
MPTDEELCIEVIDELESVPLLVGRLIEVDVRMGIVSLRGHVESIEERSAAHGAAERIVGPDRIADGVGVRRTQSKPSAG